MMRSYKLLTVTFVLLSLIFINGCDNNLPREDYIGYKTFSLVDQDSLPVTFPSDYKGQILVVGFIFTHCPDICPITVHNIQRIQIEAVKQNIKNIQFAAVSFDPDRDTPSLLKKFGKMRNINYSNWKFLTGVRDTVLELTKEMEIVAVSSDTTYLKDGSKSYFFTHTDRISLIDKRNRLRKDYIGTAVDIQEIIKDIKSLEE
ncbi:MAG: SCO family protein [Ignavibacteria bacterium]|nr:SCO family protein [Ignavibacteria bacterium]